MELSQGRILAGLCVAMVAVGAALYLTDPKDPLADPEATVVLLSERDGDAWTRIQVQGQDLAYTLTQAGGTWRLTEPVATAVDSGAMTDLLRALEGSGLAVPVPGASGEAAYGLDEPVTVQITGPGGASTLTLGRAAPAGWRTYAKAADGAVVAVGGHPRDALEVGVAGLRSRRIFDVEVSDIQAVVFDSPQGRLRIFEAEQGWWVDGYNRASLDRVDDAILGLMDLRIARFPEETIPKIVERRAWFELTDGSTLEAGFGPDVSGLTPVWTPQGMVGVMPTAQLALLGQGPTDVLDRGVLPVSLEHDTAVELRWGEAVWRTERDGPDWTRNGVYAVEPLHKLLALQQVRVGEPAPDPDTILGEVRIERRDQLRTVSIGQVGGEWVARDSAGGGAYWIGPEVAEVITTTTSEETTAPPPQ